MLTSLESALTALLDGVAPVAPTSLPLAQALGFTAAAMPPLPNALPLRNTAIADGWAFRALDLSGASAYSPLPLAAAPDWIEAGDALPEGCDCVLDADLVDCSGPVPQVSAGASPGQGMRRAGDDLEAGRPLVIPGWRLSAADLLLARIAGFDQLAVRVPRLRVIEVAAANGDTATTQFIVERARASAALVTETVKVSRDAESIAGALDGASCDLILVIGGTGAGRSDATAAALASRHALIAHNLALQPGRTAAIGRLGNTPVIAIPGAPDQALAVFLALVEPVLDRLADRTAKRGTTLPLARKIASTVGIAEIVLLKLEQDSWTPLAIGDLSLDAIRLADGWLIVPGGSEGYAAGTPVAGFALHDFR